MNSIATPCPSIPSEISAILRSRFDLTADVQVIPVKGRGGRCTSWSTSRSIGAFRRESTTPVESSIASLHSFGREARKAVEEARASST